MTLHAAEILPVGGDVEFLMPPALTGFLHAVPQTGFELAYAVDDDALIILTLRVRRADQA